MNTKKTAERISSWIADRTHEVGLCTPIVVGLSGGVDSAVVAALADLSGVEVRGLILPCWSDERDEEDAEIVAHKFCDTHVVSDLSLVYSRMRSAVSDGVSKNRLAHGNLKARLRMAALYYEANRTNALVCGTTNKTELLLGYFTKHGDGGADIEPIADVWKTDVFDLARYLGVPDCIVAKSPSAGLWEGQTDEDDFGMTYAEIDAALKRMESGTLEQTDFDARVLDMFESSEHKRVPAPICYTGGC